MNLKFPGIAGNSVPSRRETPSIAIAKTGIFCKHCEPWRLVHRTAVRDGSFCVNSQDIPSCLGEQR